MLNKTGERRHPWHTLTVVLKNFFLMAIQENCTAPVLVQSFNDLDDIVINVVVRHHLSESFMPNLIKSLHEVSDVVLEVTLVLQVFFSQQSDVKDLF